MGIGVNGGLGVGVCKLRGFNHNRLDSLNGVKINQGPV